MELTSLIEVISACHLTHYVQGPFPERGGIMMVAPPASFKSAATMALDFYPNALVLSDLTIKQAIQLREDISSDRIITLAFPAYEKLYQRHAAVASNIEGFITGLTGEGFTRANWEDQRMQIRKAHCCVIGAMTEKFYAQHFGAWIDSGFARRFLWCMYKLDDPAIIERAISNWERIDLSNHGISTRLPTGGKTIKYDVSTSEDKELLRLLKDQPSRDINYSLFKKILSALKWKFPKDPRLPIKIIRDFAESLSKHGAILTVKENGSEKRWTGKSKTKSSTLSPSLKTNSKTTSGIQKVRSSPRALAVAKG